MPFPIERDCRRTFKQSSYSTTMYTFQKTILKKYQKYKNYFKLNWQCADKSHEQFLIAGICCCCSAIFPPHLPHLAAICFYDKAIKNGILMIKIIFH